MNTFQIGDVLCKKYGHQRTMIVLRAISDDVIAVYDHDIGYRHVFSWACDLHKKSTSGTRCVAYFTLVAAKANGSVNTWEQRS